MKKNICFFIIVLLLISKIKGQEEKETVTSFRENFIEAESYLLYEEYNDALPIYLKLSKAYPENDNLTYKIGLCYLNIPYEKEKSINYFEKAINNINPNSKVDNYKETQAPPDALYYLGNAYRINDQLDKALNAYTKFKAQIDPNIYDESLVDEQILAVGRAKKMEKKPVYFEKQNLGASINSKYSESNAVVSADEKMLVYNVKLPFYDALYFSTKSNEQWSDPVNIIPDLGVDGDVYATSLSHDGKELYIYRSDGYDGNIYVSKFIDGKFHPIKKLNDNINTKYWESHASISFDGKTLYFTSNRKGGYGGLDIYEATRFDVNSDDWENVTNLGPEINTPYNEDTPFPTEDERTLYFSSYGHHGMGGYDIFYSTLLENGKWSVPMNMGYPINTTDDDLFFVPVQNGNFAYVCRFYSDSYGKTDIYRLELFSEDHPRKFRLNGIVSIPPEISLNEDLQLTVKIFDKTKKDTIQKIQLNPADSKFALTIPSGNYQLIYEGHGLEKSTENLKLQNDQSQSEITLNTQLQAERKVPPKAELHAMPAVSAIQFEKSFYKVTGQEPLAIYMKLPKGTDLTVSVYNEDSVLIKTDHIKVEHKKFAYNFTPIPGKSILRFRAVEPDGKISEGEVIVICSKENEEPEKGIDEILIKVNSLKNGLSSLATSNLKAILDNLNLEKENLTSENELLIYLKNQAQYHKYSPSLIDSLYKSFLADQKNSAAKLLNTIKELSKGSLKSIMDSIGGESFRSPLEVVNFIIAKAGKNTAAIDELLDILSRLANSDDVYYYRERLINKSQGELKKYLESIDITDENILTADDLLNFLLTNAEKQHYTTNDVYKAFFAIPYYTDDAKTLLDDMIDLSGSGYKSFLKSINLKKNNITSIEQFGKYILEASQKKGIDPSDMLALIFSASEKNALKQLIEGIKMYSNGNLKKFINIIDLRNNEIQNPQALIKYLIDHASENKYTKEDLIKVLSVIASNNLSKQNKFSRHVEEKSLLYSVITICIIAFILILIFIYERKKK